MIDVWRPEVWKCEGKSLETVFVRSDNDITRQYQFREGDARLAGIKIPDDESFAEAVNKTPMGWFEIVLEEEKEKKE